MMTAAHDKKQKLEQECAKLKKETDDKVAIQLDAAKKQAEQDYQQRRKLTQSTVWTRRHRKSTSEPRRLNSMPPNWMRTARS